MRSKLKVQIGHRKHDNLLLEYLDSLALIEDDAIQKKLLKDKIGNYVVLEKKLIRY